MPANMIVSGQADRGILICGTGIGMSIAANKVRGAYAALISDAYSAVRAEKSNNANIACFGAFTLGEKVMRVLSCAFGLARNTRTAPLLHPRCNAL